MIIPPPFLFRFTLLSSKAHLKLVLKNMNITLLNIFHSLVVLEKIRTFPSCCCYCAIICFCRIDLCHYLCYYFKSLFPALLLSYLLIHAFLSFLHTTVTFQSGCPKGTIWHTPFLYLFSAVCLNRANLYTYVYIYIYAFFSLVYMCI